MGKKKLSFTRDVVVHELIYVSPNLLSFTRTSLAVY